MKKPLREVANVTMGQSPKGTSYNNLGEGLPLLNGPTEFGEVYPNCTLFTTDSKRSCEPNDLIFCVRGSTTGRMNWADKKYSLGRGVCAIRGENINATKFIKYTIDNTLNALLAIAGGGTFPNLTKDDIADFEIPYPSTHEKIASILSAYDDLIENNLRRIKLLEEAAQMIYKEWFVNFRFPGYENTKFVNGLPEGWRMGVLGEIASVKSGFAFKSSDWKATGYPVIKIKNIYDNSVDLENCDCIEANVAEDASAFALKEGDLLIAMTGATVGKIGLMPRFRVQPYLNQRVGIFRSKDGQKIMPVLFCFFCTEFAQKQILNYAGGAAQPNISPSQIESLKMNIASINVMKECSEILGPLFVNMIILREANYKLKQARDILLPKLMSGEIEV